MSKLAFEQVFTNNTYTRQAIVSGYDSTKIITGNLLNKFILSSSIQDKFIGPNPITVFRPVENSAAIPAAMWHPIIWSSTKWYLFYGDNAAAAATRRIGCYEYNPITTDATFLGFVTMTYPTATNHTLRGFRVSLENYTTGTVSASGTSVTGSGTTWSTDRMAVGSRIGFGSTDPTQITTWYQISAVGGDTSITLTSSAGTISGGTSYVIEDMRIIMATTNATAGNGGLYIAKGLRIEDFAIGGTTIPAATTTDNIKAVYWIKDNHSATNNNSVAAGIAIEDRASWNLQNCYIINGSSTTARIWMYNFRTANTIASGNTIPLSGNITITGNQTVTGAISQLNNGRVATARHGNGNGNSSLYFATATRISRAPLSGITSGSTTFVVDSMTEVPPGGTATFTVTGALTSVEYANIYDKFIVSTSHGKCYITKFQTGGEQHDAIIGAQISQQDQVSASANSVPFLHMPIGGTTGIIYVWAEGGILFYSTASTSATTNIMYAYPLGATNLYSDTTNERIILPAITFGSIPSKFYRVLTSEVHSMGGINIGKTTNPYRLFYRTSGIDDNSGLWTEVQSDGNLSGVSTAASIQFMLDFKLDGENGLPARFQGLSIIYETADALPSQYQWSYGDSSTANGTVGFVQVATFGASLTTHTINYYRSDTNALVLTQASSSNTNGFFEYHNGSTWVEGLGSDTLNTRRRFRPSGSLPTGTDLYMTITTA